MKKYFIFNVILLCASCMCLNSCDSASKQVSMEVSNDEVLTESIQSMDLAGLNDYIADNKGKILVVNIWATWCPPCRAEIPEFIQFVDENKGTNVQVIGLSSDTFAKDVERFSQKMGMNYPIYMAKKEIMYEFKISGIPTTLFYDQEGKMVKKHVGYASKKDLEKVVQMIMEK